MLDRLLGLCFGLLAGAVAIYLAVRLVESVMAAVVTIVAVAGGLMLLGFVFKALWRRYGSDRW